MPILDAGLFSVGRDAIKYYKELLNLMCGEVNSHGVGGNDPAQDQLDSAPWTVALS